MAMNIPAFKKISCEENIEMSITVQRNLCFSSAVNTIHTAVKLSLLTVSMGHLSPPYDISKSMKIKCTTFEFQHGPNIRKFAVIVRDHS